LGLSLPEKGEVQLAAAQAILGSRDRRDCGKCIWRLFARQQEMATLPLLLCVDVRVDVPGKLEKTDAIQIMLEHSGGEALNAFMPYEKQAESDITYASLFATPRDPRVFIRLASEKEQ